MINQRNGLLELPHVECPHCGSSETEESFCSDLDYYCQKCCNFFNKEKTKG